MESIFRKVVLPVGEYEISLEHPVRRYAGNPVLSAHDVNTVWKEPHLKVVTTHNAGIAVFQEKVIMLFRAHLRNGISVIGQARSSNGLTDWEIHPELFLKPDGTEGERGGVEDARIAEIEGKYYITYSAYHGLIKDRVRVSLATTCDFVKVDRYGPVSDLDMRNVVIFPQKIDKQYVALFRPNDPDADEAGGQYAEIRIGFSDELTGGRWRISEKPIMKQSGGPGAFSDKIGPGATPVWTKHGWLNIFHGVRRTMDGNPYVLGVAIHDLADPEKIRVSNIPILFPSYDDCRVKSDAYIHVPNVVFTCGALRLQNGALLIYYGGNDTVMNVAISHEDILAELCYRYPQDPETGQPLYEI
jgi:predicted GH43/DUF377 family glycosyl hydrolase